MFSLMCDTGIFYYTSQCVGYRLATERPWSLLILLGLILLLLFVVHWKRAP